MSSQEYRIVKKSRRIAKGVPQEGGNEMITKTSRIRMIGSTGGEGNYITQQESSSFAGDRRLDRDALTVVRDKNQMPVRASAGMGQTTSLSKTVIQNNYSINSHSSRNSAKNERQL